MNVKEYAIRTSWIRAVILAGFLVSSAAISASAQSVGGVEPSAGTTTSSGQVPAILRGVGIDQHLGQQIPLDATFKDENGKTVALRSYFGKKPVVLILAYYSCPMLCSEVLRGAATSFKNLGFRLGDQYEALTVSFDPSETPALAAKTKRTYIQRYDDPSGAAGWHFLTGQKPEIDKLTQAVGFRYTYDTKTGQYYHAAGLVVITPAGKIAQYFYGVRFPDRDMRLALVQSSKEKIGSVTDQILLFCCTYDPSIGRYHALVARILQVAGGITILVVGVGLLLLYRWDSKRKKRSAQTA
jgi:protein SCO1/2